MEKKKSLTGAIQFQPKFEISIEPIRVWHVRVHLEGRQHSQIHAPLAQLLNLSFIRVPHRLVYVASEQYRHEYAICKENSKIERKMRVVLMSEGAKTGARGIVDELNQGLK